MSLVDADSKHYSKQRSLPAIIKGRSTTSSGHKGFSPVLSRSRSAVCTTSPSVFFPVDGGKFEGSFHGVGPPLPPTLLHSSPDILINRPPPQPPLLPLPAFNNNNPIRITHQKQRKPKPKPSQENNTTRPHTGSSVADMHAKTTTVHHLTNSQRNVSITVMSPPPSSLPRPTFLVKKPKPIATDNYLPLL